LVFLIAFAYVARRAWLRLSSVVGKDELNLIVRDGVRRLRPKEVSGNSFNGSLSP
jgi:hypothetical protein